MTNLVEVERWEEGVYQLETSDPVVGGPEGIDNLQAKQLANRTRFLKKSIEAAQSNFDSHVAAADPHPQYATHSDLAEKVAALVAQSPETLDTLSELAKALGNDPNFATTITNALALKAPLDSPPLTGKPTSPTPALYDNTKRIATMEALQAAGFHFPVSYGVAILADVSLQADQGNKWFEVGAANVTATLPLIANVALGTTYTFKVSQVGFVLRASGSEKLNGQLESALSTYSAVRGETVSVVANGNGAWYVVSSGVGGAAFLAGRGATVTQGVAGSTLAVNTSRTNTLSFTAPCSGRVIAIATVTTAAQQASGGAVNNSLLFNGNLAVSDRTRGPQIDIGSAFVSAGQAFTMQQICTASESAAPDQSFTMQLSYLFVPGA